MIDDETLAKIGMTAEDIERCQRFSEIPPEKIKKAMAEVLAEAKEVGGILTFDAVERKLFNENQSKEFWLKSAKATLKKAELELKQKLKDGEYWFDWDEIQAALGLQAGKRRCNIQIFAIKSAIYHIAAAYKPMTVRQMFYQLVVKGVIAKTEAEYKGTIVRLIGEMRLNGEISFNWFTDSTRWMRKPRTHSSAENALKITADAYRRSLWDDQDSYVEIWLEKESLAGVLYAVTSEYDVPLMATKGYSSLSFLYSAAEAIKAEHAKGKDVYLYQFGDHDPSGADIPRSIEDRLRKMTDGVPFNFERIAIQPWMISVYNLMTRPTKKTDSRAKNFEGESVELDSLPPDTLKKLCRHCIEKHIDHAVLENTRNIEKLERETLGKMAKSFAA